MAFNSEQSQNGAPLYEAIKQRVRLSPYVNADEMRESKKVQEKSFAPESIDGIFCHELKTILKELIGVRNRHREEPGLSPGSRTSP